VSWERGDEEGAEDAEARQQKLTDHNVHDIFLLGGGVAREEEEEK